MHWWRCSASNGDDDRDANDALVTVLGVESPLPLLRSPSCDKVPFISCCGPSWVSVLGSQNLAVVIFISMLVIFTCSWGLSSMLLCICMYYVPTWGGARCSGFQCRLRTSLGVCSRGLLYVWVPESSASRSVIFLGSGLPAAYLVLCPLSPWSPRCTPCSPCIAWRYSGSPGLLGVGRRASGSARRMPAVLPAAARSGA